MNWLDFVLGGIASVHRLLPSNDKFISLLLPGVLSLRLQNPRLIAAIAPR
jgi:hypothetical protein